jgi:hypothetical protein
MALIHYYKFNGNLYDSIGVFDLSTDVGTVGYTTGKLGGSTGAVTPGMMDMWGAYGTGAAASGFLAVDSSEAATGVTEWSLTFWVYIGTGGYSDVPIVSLLTSTSGQTACNFAFSGMMNYFYGAGMFYGISTGSWQFISLVKSGSTLYLSINGSAATSTAFTTGSGTSGKTQFNGIRCGLPTSSGSLNGLRIDDLRLYNHALTGSEISGIYNGGSPAEATATSPSWNSPDNHWKFENNPNDSMHPSVSGWNASGVSSYQYLGGLVPGSTYSANIPAYGAPSYNSISLGSVSYPLMSSTSSWSAYFASNFTSGSSENSNSFVRFYGTDSNIYFYINHAGTSGTYGTLSALLGTSGIATSFDISSGTPQKFMFCYDKVSIRGLFYYKDGFSGSEVTKIYQLNSTSGDIASPMRECIISYAPQFMPGSGGRLLDNFRFFKKAMSGENYDLMWNTEYSITPAGGSASGSGATVNVSSIAGTAFGNNVAATGAGVTVAMVAPAGAATFFVNGAATGLLSVVTITTWSGTASDAYASGLLGTITVSPITGISPLAFGSLGTIQVTSFSGQAAGGALSSGALASVTVSSFAGIAFPEFIGTGSLGTVSATAIEAVASISTSIQLSYCACDAEIGWQQSLPITGFVSAVQGEDAISARITPVVSGIDANIVFFEQRTLTASSSYTYDLRSLTDFLGQSFSLSRGYAISVVMTSGSATISPGASNPFQWFFNSTTANVTITSGNSFMFAQKGSAIVSNSAKTILVTNPSGLSACVYKIAILGGR